MPVPDLLSKDKRPITRKDVALVVVILTTVGGVLRYGEKRLDSVEAKAQQFSLIQTDTERQQRQEDIRMINGKLDLITKILLEIKRR